MEHTTAGQEYTDPFELAVPPEAKRFGQPPFWTPGQAVTWTYRRFDFELDPIEVCRPMRVIEDGPDGAAVWMPGGAEVVDTGLVGWEGMSAHDVPLDVRFRPRGEAPERFPVPTTWQGHGVLKLAPPNVPFSVWVLVGPAEAGVGAAAEAKSSSAAHPVRIEWYINLESTHRRTAEAVFTSDLILDITFPVAEEPLHLPDGTLNPRGAVFKDVDEITAAATYGYWPAAWTDIVRRNAALVLERLDEHRWAFDPKWADLARELAGVGPEGAAQSGAAEPVAAESRTAGKLRLGPATAASGPAYTATVSVSEHDTAATVSVSEHDTAATTSAGEPEDPAATSAGEPEDPAATSANRISAGQREHRTIPNGCYIRPDSR